MRYQSREFHKFFSGINCCSYNTHGFHVIFAFRNLREKFSREISLNLFSRKNAKFRENVCEMGTKIFAFFRETFRSLELLYFRFTEVQLCFFKIVKFQFLCKEYPDELAYKISKIILYKIWLCWNLSIIVNSYLYS